MELPLTEVGDTTPHTPHRLTDGLSRRQRLARITRQQVRVAVSTPEPATDSADSSTLRTAA
jgi:hypothetical protein